jgi:peptidoglycan/LPS O-acetylase OafA/YrhL
MNRPFSVYLDFVRFFAALLVYLYHSNQRFLIKSILPMSHFGHSAVIIFFVLSGFVIAFVTATKETTWSSYSASRISRVFSVALPAIILTIVLDGIGRGLDPTIYASHPYDQFLARIVGSLLMLDEVWLISITSFSNTPYWSICYEWWYYVTFAMVMFLPRRIGWIAAAATLLAIGPKLILLAPIWWLGVLLYRWQRLRELSLWTSWSLIILSVVGLVFMETSGVTDRASEGFKNWVGADLYRELTFSKWFISDYILGVLIFMNFAGVRNVAAAQGKFILVIEKPVRLVANYTFTLYLLHQPLFLFWAALIHGDPLGPWYWIMVSLLTLISVAVVGYFTENRRQILRKFLFIRFNKLFPTSAAGGHGAQA